MIRLCDVIAQVESSGNAGAIRFEPATYATIGDHRFDAAHANCVIANRCSRGTADMILSTSWGLYQLMGFNLYARPGQVAVAAFLANPLSQMAALDPFLASHGHRAGEDAAWLENEASRLAFATKYNGPGEPEAYAAALLDAYKRLFQSLSAS